MINNDNYVKSFLSSNFAQKLRSFYIISGICFCSKHLYKNDPLSLSYLFTYNTEYVFAVTVLRDLMEVIADVIAEGIAHITATVRIPGEGR